MVRRSLVGLCVVATVACGAAGACMEAAGHAPGSSAQSLEAVSSGSPGAAGTPMPSLRTLPSLTSAPSALPSASPAPTPSPASTPAPAPTPEADPFAVTNFASVPKCDLGGTEAFLVSFDQWPLTLVDKTYAVTDSYVPPDLVDVRKAGFGGSYKVRAVVIADLAALRSDAAKASSALAIFSAYRSYKEQTWSFGHWSNVLGPSALMSSARAGHSEHQLGLAIDFRAYGGPVPWAYRNFATETAAGAWLARNAWKYGFVMSYPWNKEAQVCYGYEPWHYRYVGRDEAAAIHASGQTLRVWLWQHQPDQLWKTGAARPTPAPEPRTPLVWPSPSPGPA